MFTQITSAAQLATTLLRSPSMWVRIAWDECACGGKCEERAPRMVRLFLN